MHLIFFVAALRRRTPSSVSHIMHDLSHRVACVGPRGIESHLNYLFPLSSLHRRRNIVTQASPIWTLFLYKSESSLVLDHRHQLSQSVWVREERDLEGGGAPWQNRGGGGGGRRHPPIPGA